MTAQTLGQTALDFAVPASDLFPKVTGLRNGDLWEGYDGKAFPRALRVLGVQPEVDGQVTVIYSVKAGSEKRYGAKTLPADTPVDIRPPF